MTILSELKEDKKLELSIEKDSNFGNKDQLKRLIAKQLINYESLQDKFSALKKTISYPNNYVLASFVEGIYKNDRDLYTGKDGQYLHGKVVYPELGDWQLLTIGYDPNSVGYDHSVTRRVKSFAAGVTGASRLNGYSGAAYWNPNTQQVIIVHSGTKNTGGWDADLYGVFLNEHVAQIDSAVTFTDKIIEVLREVNEEKGSNIQLFITGHSLGAWLAPITAFSAKYLKKDGDYFVANDDFEKTGYHTSTVIFDGPGCEEMLRHIQRNLMKRYGPSFINSLDIVNYLSVPNIINACNPQVGEVYRLFVNLSQEDKDHLAKLKGKGTVGKSIESVKNLSLEGYITVQAAATHKIVNIKEVFDPKTGEVLKDNGNLRIERVEDWPLLISSNKKEEVRSKTLQGGKWTAKTLTILAKLAAKIIGATIRITPFVSVIDGITDAHEIYKSAYWYNELMQELDAFLKLADESNNYRLSKCITCFGVNQREIHYETKPLNESYKNERRLNAFTQSERQFLERYKFLEKFQNVLQKLTTLEKLFDSFRDDKDLVNDTIRMLRDCRVENGIISSKNLQEFIPYIKRMLHLFPEIKSEVEIAYEKLPSNMYNKIYQSISSSYLESIKNFLDFERETSGLETFLADNNLKVLHTVQSSTSLGVTKICKIFNLVRNDYRDEKYHAFLNLDKAFCLGKEIYINFLKQIDHKYLLVIECDDMPSNSDKVKGFLVELFNILQDNQDIKVILVTEKGSNLSNSIKESEYVVNNPSKYQEGEIEVKWNDLTPNSQKKLLGKRVTFQGQEVALDTIVDRSNSDIDRIIDPETIVELFKDNKIEIGKALPDLGETEDYYIERKLVKKVKVKEEVLRDENLNDLFVISNISKGDVEKLVNEKESVRNFEEKDPDKSNPIRFITLSESAETNFENLCAEYSHHNIHWLKRDNKGNLIWQKSHGNSLSGLRKYIENYESDLPEEEYSNGNASIKMMDVSDINQFNERFIVVAAEPGMGKTTALTLFGTQKANESQWIIRINLLDYKEKLEQVNFREEGSVITFLHGDEANTLTKKLLKSRLNQSGNIVLLLDGFDEITPEGQENIVNLLKQLQKTKVEKVLISTRLHLRNKLENSLATVAYTLKPLFSEDQKEFLQKFWRKDEALKIAIDSGSLDNDIKKLLEFVAKSIGDKERKFMGIPLQLRMVAEAFQEEAKEALISSQGLSLDTELNILELYGRFIEAKYSVYAREKMRVNVKLNKVQKNSFTKDFNKIHMRLATRVLFPEMEESFVGAKLPSKEEEYEMNYIGIVQCIGNKIIFTHRTFAEYFFAGFLYNKLKSDDEGSKKYKAIIEFLAKELFESKNEVVKTFLDYHLAKGELHSAVLKGKSNDAIITLLENNTDINITDALGRTALHYAAQEDNKDIVEILINNDADIKQTDELGKTALHYTARCNDKKQIVKLLLDNILENTNDYINKKDKNNRTAVYYAAQQGNWKIVGCLIKRGASVDGLDKEKLLFHYVYKGDLSVISNIVEKEKKIDVTAIKDNYDNTLLHIATQKGHLEVVKLLLEQKPEVNVINNSGRKPINYAAESKYWNIVECLLKNGAELNDLNDRQRFSLLEYSSQQTNWEIIELFMKDNSRDNYFNKLNDQQRVELLCHSIRSKNFNIAEFLIKAGTKVNGCDYKNKKPIYYAAENEYWNIVQVLLENQAHFNDLANISRDKKFSLFRYSACNKCWRIVQMFFVQSQDNSCTVVDLLSNILDLPIGRNKYFDHLKNKQKMHFLQYITPKGNLDIIRFCIEKLIKDKTIIDVDYPNSYGKTFLHFAAQDGRLDIVEYLIDEKGANVNATTENGSTPLHLAARNGHSEIVRYLTGKGVNVGVKDNNGKIALDLATENHRLETIGYLKEEEARIFYNQNRYNEALQLYQEIFDIKKRPDVLGPEHPDTLTTHHNMAEVLEKQGKYTRAWQVFNEVFEKRKGILGPDHPDTLMTRNNMAVVLNKQGKYKEALLVLKKILNIQTRSEVLGPEHSDTLTTHHNMAEVLEKQGKYTRAWQVFNEVFEKRKGILGPDHPDTLMTRHNMAVVLDNQGKYYAALTEFKKVLAKRIEILGPDHPDTLRTHHNMAVVLFKQGKYDEALFKKVLYIQKDILGPDHPDTLMTRNNMAVVLEKQGKYYAALTEFKKVLAKRIEILGPDHPDTLMTRNNMAVVLNNQGKYDAALTEYKTVLVKRIEILGPDHPDTLMTRHNMAVVLDNQGKYDAALTEFKKVLDIQKDVLGPDHPDTLRTRNDIEIVTRRQESGCTIQFYQKQEEAYCDLSGCISHDLQNASIKSVSQGLYLPSFKARDMLVTGKCVAITRALSQALFSSNQQQFLNNLATSAELYERLAQGKQISKREEKEVFALSNLLDNFEKQQDSPKSSLPSSLICTKSYQTLNDLPNYIDGIKGDFAIHLVTSNHVVAIYRIGDNYSYFDSNVAFVSGMTTVQDLMKVVEKAVRSADYELPKEGFLVEHFNIAKANSQLSSEDKQILAREIKIERQFLAEQDKEFGLIKINGQEISRVQLYDFGTKVSVKGSVPFLINADMNLSSKNFSEYLSAGKVSMTAREYLENLKGSDNTKEAVQATKFIPFIGSKSEIEKAEQTRKQKGSLLELAKETINFIFSAISLTIAKVDKISRDLKQEV